MNKQTLLTPGGKHAIETTKNGAGAAVGPGIDLFGWAPVRRTLLWPGFPYVFQVLALVVFLWLAVLGWGQYAPEGVPSKLYAKTNDQAKFAAMKSKLGQ